MSRKNSSPLPLAIGGTALVVAILGFAIYRSVNPPAPVPSETNPERLPVPTAGTTPAVPGDTAGTGGLQGSASPAATSTSSLPPLASARTATAPDAHVHSPEEDSPSLRTQPEQLYVMFEEKAVTLIDVRDPTSFRVRHIPGSLSIPLLEIQSRVSEIPKDKPIVTYCT